MSNVSPGVPRQDYLSVLPASAAAQVAQSVLCAVRAHRDECELYLVVPGAELPMSHLRQLAALVVQFGDSDVARRADLLFRQACKGERASLEQLISAGNRIERELGPWGSEL